MDIELEKRINDTIAFLKHISLDSVEEQLTDPIAKMMLVSLLYESQKIRDYIDGVSDRIVEKFCEDFIPRKEVEAMPAIAVIKAQFKAKKDEETVKIGNNTAFTYKLDSKTSLNYLPLFKNLIIPESDIFILTENLLRRGSDSYEISMENPNSMWVGIETGAEIETLQGLSIMINGTRGVIPEHIYVGSGQKELEFADMSRMDDMEMAEPFDAHQASGKMFSFIDSWKDQLLEMEDSALICITDELTDRDVFKRCNYPPQLLEMARRRDLGNLPRIHTLAETGLCQGICHPGKLHDRSQCRAGGECGREHPHAHPVLPYRQASEERQFILPSGYRDQQLSLQARLQYDGRRNNHQRFRCILLQ